MGQALYRKYRSKRLSEIVGQEHITQTLERAVKNGKLSHAYLFTGPRGVGKTSIARILAHEVNDLPYTDESIHLDIIEIDAASNRRIDEIRDLRDKVHIAPTSAKYKVYIIDEVHMLTKEAFNALLKTLEEPPAHVIFILATTEAHKLPETIVSRTQRFSFKAINDEKAVAHLKELASKEDISIEEDALRLLAEHGNGSFRDSIGLLDQVSGSKDKITRGDVELLIGIAPSQVITDLLQATLEGTTADVAKALSDLTERGIAPVQAAKQLAALARAKLLEGNSDNPLELTSLLESLLSVPSAQSPASALELALFKVTASRQVRVRNVLPISSLPLPAKSKVKLPEQEPEAKSAPEESPQQSIKNDTFEAWWPQLLMEIKKHNNTLYGVMRMAQPELNNNKLNLRFAFGFHAKKISDTATKVKIETIIATLTGQSVALEISHDKNVHPKAAPEEIERLPGDISDTLLPTELGNNDLRAITSVFGGGEVLET